MKLGFIGLGNMGFGMASNLLAVNHELVCFDIDKEKLKLLNAKAIKAESIAEVAKNTEVIVLCLPHPKISHTVVNELIKYNASLKTIIETSTLTPEDTQKLYDKLKKHKVEFLCSPMLGGKNAANNKKIHFLVEGNSETFQKYKKLFEDMGNRVDFMGSPPSATLAKLAYNMCRYSNLATAAEVARFVKAYTKDTESIYNLLKEGSLDNFGQVWGEDIKAMVVDGKPYTPSKIPEKDLTMLIKLAKIKKLSSKLLAAIKKTYTSLTLDSI